MKREMDKPGQGPSVDRPLSCVSRAAKILRTDLMAASLQTSLMSEPE